MKHYRPLREKEPCDRYIYGQISLNNSSFLCNLFLTSYRWNNSWGKRGERCLPSCFHKIMEIIIKMKIKQSPSVPSSANSWWPSSAYFPLALFRLVLPVCDETEERVIFLKMWTFHTTQKLLTSQSSHYCPEEPWEEWKYQLERHGTGW